MAAPTAADPSRILLSRWKRDYHFSLALLVAGVIILAFLAAFSYWASSTGSYSSSFWTGLADRVLGTMGGMLTIVGGIFAYHNWALLRQSESIV